MEILALMFVFLMVWIIFKVLGAVFYAGAFLITLPLKILGAVLIGVVMIPLGIFSFIVSLVSVLIPLLPIALLVLGAILIARR